MERITIREQRSETGVGRGHWAVSGDEISCGDQIWGARALWPRWGPWKGFVYRLRCAFEQLPPTTFKPLDSQSFGWVMKYPPDLPYVSLNDFFSSIFMAFFWIVGAVADWCSDWWTPNGLPDSRTRTVGIGMCSKKGGDSDDDDDEENVWNSTRRLNHVTAIRTLKFKCGFKHSLIFHVFSRISTRPRSKITDAYRITTEMRTHTNL